MRAVIRNRAEKALLYGLLTAGLVPIMIPFVWMLATSLKSREHVSEERPHLLPWNEHDYVTTGRTRREILVLVDLKDGRSKIRPRGSEQTELVTSSAITRVRRVEPQWRNYTRILRPVRGDSDSDFGRFLLNTAVIAGLSVVGQVLSSALVGWGFARMRFAGRDVLFMIMLATMMVPGQVGMIPTFMIFRKLGWIDTFLPLIVPAWLSSPFFAFLYRQYFLGIPLAMDEAARIDGASPLAVWWMILLPMARPVTVTVAVFTFFGAWNDFLGPLIYINSDHKRTLSLALAKFHSAYGSDVPAVMAAATIMLIPVLVVYFLSQRALTQGLVVGGVKG